MSNNDLLSVALATAVPLRIAELEAAGGPTEGQIDAVIAFAPELAEKGDRLLYRSERRGETAVLFTRLVDALSVLAFQPGGCRFAGNVWKGGVANRSPDPSPPLL
jgi:hypothetical protein